MPGGDSLVVERPYLTDIGGLPASITLEFTSDLPGYPGLSQRLTSIRVSWESGVSFTPVRRAIQARFESKPSAPGCSSSYYYWLPGDTATTCDAWYLDNRQAIARVSSIGTMELTGGLLTLESIPLRETVSRIRQDADRRDAERRASEL